jgi:hypothetical protein
VSAVLSGVCLLVGFAGACCFVATVLKGKWLAAVVLLVLTAGLGYFVTGIRLAKPTSWWARRYYDADKLRLAFERFELDSEQVGRKTRAALRAR